MRLRLPASHGGLFRAGSSPITHTSRTSPSKASGSGRPSGKHFVQSMRRSGMLQVLAVRETRQQMSSFARLVQALHRRWTARDTGTTPAYGICWTGQLWCSQSQPSTRTKIPKTRPTGLTQSRISIIVSCVGTMRYQPRRPQLIRSPPDTGPERYKDAPIGLQLVCRRFEDEKLIEAYEYLKELGCL